MLDTFRKHLTVMSIAKEFMDEFEKTGYFDPETGEPKVLRIISAEGETFTFPDVERLYQNSYDKAKEIFMKNKDNHDFTTLLIRFYGEILRDDIYPIFGYVDMNIVLFYLFEIDAWDIKFDESRYFYVMQDIVNNYGKEKILHEINNISMSVFGRAWHEVDDIGLSKYGEKFCREFIL